MRRAGLEPPGRLVAAVLLVLVGLGAQPTALAHDVDRALAPLMPSAAATASAVAPGAAAVRPAPLLRWQWQQRLPAPDRLGPPQQRPADAALLQAARAGRWAEVEGLLREGRAGVRADANATDPAGTHVLALAAAAGHDSVLRLLLEAGADLDRRGDDGFTALGAAAWHGQRSTVRLLLRAGADVQRLGSSGHTALHLAALAAQVAVVQDLLAAGAPIDLLNGRRETALDVAGEAGVQPVMDLLIRGGADLTMAGRR